MVDTLALLGPWPCRTRLPAGRAFWITPHIRVRTDRTGDVILGLHCSLPNLLFGHNGQVLENQEALTTSLITLRSAVADYVELPKTEELRASRVDLAWNFNLDARPIILAHAYLRVPRIRAAATRHGDGDGISWRGKQSRYALKLYNKSREMRVPGNTLRAEITLRSPRLGEELPRNTWSQWRSCWGVFQRLMRSVPPVSGHERVRNWTEAVALEPPDIRNRVLSRMATHVSPRTLRRYAQQLESAAALLGTGPFCWRELLTGDMPPNPVNVSPRAQRPATKLNPSLSES